MDYTTAFNAGSRPPGGGIDGFDAAAPAPEFAPVPPGVYAARVLQGEYTTTRAGSDAYRMRFAITDGPYAGRTLVRTWTFGERAIGYTKRDLAPFGLITTDRLLVPFPAAGKEFHVRLVVALQLGNDGVERNDIKRIEVVRVADGPAAGFELRPAGPVPGDGAAS